MIFDLAREGLTVSAIARRTGLDRKTIRKYLAQGLEPSAYTPRPPRPTLVGPFEAYLRERLQTFAEELAESFGLFQRIGRVDGIGVVGALFGQLLAAVGQTEAALGVLDQAADAFTTLRDSQGVEQVRTIQAIIRKAAE